MFKYALSFFICLFFLKPLIADSYEMIVLSIHDEKKIETDKKYKFSVTEAIGNWQDSLGNYGKAKILFFLESKRNSNVNLNGMIELLDKNNEKIWLSATRKSSDQDAGVGKMKIVETTKKHKKLLNKKCTYAINYFEDRSYMKIKCS